MPDENAPIEEIRAYFSGDRFATDACGCTIEEATRGHAVCSLTIEPHHLNAFGIVMGGAIFTLADFALAIACNVGENPTVAVTNSIEFMSGAKGTTLIATCDLRKGGNTCGFYGVEVTDELGTKVAHMEATCIRRKA